MIGFFLAMQCPGVRSYLDTHHSFSESYLSRPKKGPPPALQFNGRRGRRQWRWRQRQHKQHNNSSDGDSDGDSGGGDVGGTDNNQLEAAAAATATAATAATAIAIAMAMAMLEPKMAGTYVRYPYLAFHSNRALRYQQASPH